jgi:cobalt-zinc-cadmium efflux system protein
VVLTAGGWGKIEKIKAAIKDRLKEDCNIVHSSLEFEHEDRAHENADLYGHGKPEEEENRVHCACERS